MRAGAGLEFSMPNQGEAWQTTRSTTSLAGRSAKRLGQVVVPSFSLPLPELRKPASFLFNPFRYALNLYSTGPLTWAPGQEQRGPGSRPRLA